jgi:hypothetical protein
LIGYCICANKLRASELIKGLTEDEASPSSFVCEVHPFLHGGTERYAVSFRSMGELRKSDEGTEVEVEPRS